MWLCKKSKLLNSSLIIATVRELTMSILLGPYDIGYIPPSRQEPRRLSRRRTVSTSFEQTRQQEHRTILKNVADKKSKSYAYEMEELPRLDLKRKALINSYMSSISEEGEEQRGEQDGAKDTFERIPGMGIYLTLFMIIVYQGGNVLTKKMSMNPFLLLLLRDFFTIFFHVPVNVATSAPVVPLDKKALFLFTLRAVSMTILLCGYFYAVRHLPLADVMMISSIKPAVATLLSCLFLKESCGAMEIVNLLLTISGIFLVVQPSSVFGNNDGQQYTPHMIYTALGLLGANIFGSTVVVIIRYMKAVHWATQAITVRFIIVAILVIVCGVSGLLCVPACGQERWGVLVLALVAWVCQYASIKSLQLEEAHVISLLENATSIIVSLLYQIIIFNDIPNTIKIIGALLTLTSIIIIGLQKILKARQISCSTVHKLQR